MIGLHPYIMYGVKVDVEWAFQSKAQRLPSIEAVCGNVMQGLTVTASGKALDRARRDLPSGGSSSQSTTAGTNCCTQNLKREVSHLT